MSGMPANWEPPYPSWVCELGAGPAEIAVAYLGIQHARSHDPSATHTQIREILAAEDGPDHITRAHYRDASNYENPVFICYWRDPERQQRFARSPAFDSWWHAPARLTDQIGLWWEGFTIPLRRAETLFSSTHPEGLARMNSGMAGPVREHAYPGGMRDRIPDSPRDGFETSHQGPLRRSALAASRGARLRVTPPENACLICSGQNWSDCSPEELAVYLDVVQPNLRAGMDFLRDHPLETGCLSCRFMDETDASGRSMTKSFGAVLFLSMQHLEEWTWNHPTHRAIFQSFHELVKARDFKLDLKLWHEVFVLPAETSRFEYVNCHPRTGLLPFFPVTAGGEPAR